MSVLCQVLSRNLDVLSPTPLTPLPLSFSARVGLCGIGSVQMVSI